MREALAGLPEYRAGTSGPATRFKASSNENPHPPLPGVLAAVAESAASMNRYPDIAAVALRERLASHCGVSVDEVAVGTGSVALLQQVLLATCEPGDEVVYAWRSFEAYPILARLVGARSVPVPLLADGRHDLPSMLASISPATRAVLVCSPNNPTGPAVGAAELTEFLDAVPADVLVVLDEAYAEFVDDPAAADGLTLRHARPNVVVLRTFSKAYGLAGLRVGYAVAGSQVAGALRSTGVPFGVSSVAQAAAIASLAATEEMTERVGVLVSERSRVLAGLRENGWNTPDTQGNFVWLDLGEHAETFGARCENAGLAVRTFPGEGVRVTIAEPDANDLLLHLSASPL